MKAKEMTDEERRMCDEFLIHYENDTLEKELVLKAARWKDRQFKEYLEKKMLYASFVTPLDKKKDIQRKEIETDIYYKIINELFKEE